MQKFIKNLVWVVTSAILSPFVIAGFIAAAMYGSFAAGVSLTATVFDKLGDWVQE